MWRTTGQCQFDFDNDSLLVCSGSRFPGGYPVGNADFWIIVAATPAEKVRASMQDLSHLQLQLQ